MASMSLPKRVALAAVLSFVLCSTAEAICFLDNSSGHPLDTPKDSNGKPKCAEGFHCPGFDPDNETTYPTFCPPTPECAVSRAFGELCEESQGTTEPILCPEKFYCPTATEIVSCPEGYFCLPGSAEPTKCPPLSICKEESRTVRYFGSVLMLALAYVLAIVALVLYRTCFIKSTLPTDFENAPHISPQSATPENDPNGQRDPSVQVLAEGFRHARGGSNSLLIQFDNLRVFAPARGKRRRHIEVLQGVTGELRPTRVTAIMGPSGSGKSVLLNALLGRLPRHWKRKGELSINGDNQPGVSGKFRQQMGFVPQSDFLHRELTVYQNLYYAAQLHLPSSWSAEMKRYFLSAILDAIQLTKQRDILIGDEENRGVSGGQRRRCSIGVELAAAPLALFLDEPTSGLDSSTALDLCRSLTQIAVDANITIAMIIHQPRVEIWEALDEVLFLSPGGRTVYQGPRDKAQKFFEDHYGVKFPPSANPADVIVDQVSTRGADLADLWLEHLGKDNTNNNSIANKKDGEAAVEVDEGSDTDGAEEDNVVDGSFDGAGFFHQVLLFHNRALSKQLSDLRPFIVETVVLALVAIVLGLSIKAYNPLGEYKEYKLISLQPQSFFLPQVFMYCCMSVSFACATAGVNVFVNDRLIYFREAASGCSRVAYYLGTAIVSFYRVFLAGALFSMLFHIIPGMFVDYWLLFAAFVLVSFNTYALGAMFAMAFDARQAPLIAAVSSLIVCCFSGFIPFPRGLKFLSFAFWACEILQYAFFSPQLDRFEEQYSDYGWVGDSVGMAVGIMVAIGILIHVVAFLAMIFLDRDKQR